MSRLDHCFVLKMRDGRSGMAFCSAEDRDVERARSEADRVLAGEEHLQGAELTYLGVLDYRQMEDAAADKLSAFVKRDPVWLVFFEIAAEQTR